MNNNSVYSILLFLLLSMLGLDLNAQDSLKAEAWDRSYVDYRPASAENIGAYKQMSEYSYDRYKEPKSWWELFKQWLWSKIVQIGLRNNGVVYFLIGLAVLILLFVILKLLGVKISGLFIFTQNNKITNLNFKQGEEDIYDENLDKLLVVAIKNKAYREAVRIRYLLSLRHLDSADLIDWRPWKTNKEYYYELSLSEQKELFKSLVISYEYIWYGLFDVEEERFIEVETAFNQFEKLIGTKKISA